jgi:cytochrome P450
MATLTERAARRVPPGPRGRFLTGSARDLLSGPLRLYSEARREYGDIVRFRAFPGMYWYLLCHPDDIEYVLQKNQSNFRKMPAIQRAIGLLAGQGLFTSEGSLWLRQRRLAQPAYHRKQLANFGSVMSAAAQSMVERCAEHAKSGRPLDIAAEMVRVALGIVSQTLLSTDISGHADVVGEAVREALDHASYRLNHPFALPIGVPTPRNRRFLRARATLDKIVYGVIEERRRAPEPVNDLLGMFLAARDEETGEGMSDTQLPDEVMTTILAGHETTAAALSWSWYLLASHREAEEKLHDELARVLGGRTPTAEDAPNLPFTRMVFEETLRLYPPAWAFPRQTIAEDEIDGYTIPGGSLLVLCQYITQRHPDFWEDPERFDPERFSAERSAGRPKFAYFPFGGGARQCIGNHFAILEGQLILATIAQHYSMRLVPGHVVEPDTTFTLRPRHGVLVTLNKR